nr:hypothetical protein [Tanacetum cinerariifolium]
MFGQYEYGSQPHVVGGSSCQPNVGAVSRRRSRRDTSLGPEEEAEPKTSTGCDEYDEPKSRGPRTEEEVSLRKSWVRISEVSVEGNSRKNKGFWLRS